ncbi:response regulator transcription factor [Marinitenerispora sediminis]|uniref:DNA-binding response regulator n=1 Tax=Marinitenerispora sediminis TaxID=1931232 RepID=A0A368SZB0_9ACTN|nr:response regulator transcription factor [Marinitenerispora sediminis]RCV47992.1 DNA-binding response regulator [Marinitenerispora sediminis]RCV48999.1 DNA-binding response regulator [Marinitenerispora sediminis]RCV50586.1 DNA-binding response regulator [Marinitenerispora sediminis]
MTETATPPHVLVIDDEPNIRDLVQAALRFHGFGVSTARSGSEGLAAARSHRPDLIVLDVLLPDISGFDVCRQLREGGDNVPVIYLTARDTPSDTVTGLSLGGDDYVTKPFSVEALVARIRALLRRARRHEAAAAPADGEEDGVLRFADLELDERSWTVRRAGEPLELSPTEFRLLAYLMNNAGQVLTRAQLLENVWGWDYAGQSQIVETYVSYLRRKLDPLGPPLIHTQRGVGYALRAQDPA